MFLDKILVLTRSKDVNPVLDSFPNQRCNKLPQDIGHSIGVARNRIPDTFGIVNCTHFGQLSQFAQITIQITHSLHIKNNIGPCQGITGITGSLGVFNQERNLSFIFSDAEFPGIPLMTLDENNGPSIFRVPRKFIAFLGVGCSKVVSRQVRWLHRLPPAKAGRGQCQGFVEIIVTGQQTSTVKAHIATERSNNGLFVFLVRSIRKEPCHQLFLQRLEKRPIYF
mmetsp:Transcript_11540/g.16939  ORF Transcript_11540/g.16939 Transcript_11540/m.16939 type:complete len:224 (+) Transcript_11540:394-1065(+)